MQFLFVDPTKELGGTVPKNFPECVKRVVIFPFQLNQDARVCFFVPVNKIDAVAIIFVGVDNPSGDRTLVEPPRHVPSFRQHSHSFIKHDFRCSLTMRNVDDVPKFPNFFGLRARYRSVTAIGFHLVVYVLHVIHTKSTIKETGTIKPHSVRKVRKNSPVSPCKVKKSGGGFVLTWPSRKCWLSWGSIGRRFMG